MKENVKDETEAIIRAKFLDAETPGFQAEFDPDEADKAGAFVEDALTETEALDSTPDLINNQG
jgi:hypothetical protein